MFCGVNKGDLTIANGTVKWVNQPKGFGFIATKRADEIFSSLFSALMRAGISPLDGGQAVTCDIQTGGDGRESTRELALS